MALDLAVDFRTRCERRSSRARGLARRHPASSEALEFYAEIASLQREVDAAHPLSSRDALVSLVVKRGPVPLREAARELDEAACEQACASYLEKADVDSTRSFFARVLLQARWAQRPEDAALSSDHGPHACSRCGHPPQVGCLRPEGDGTAVSLVCSLCLDEWPYRRGCCPGCGLDDERRLAFFAAPELDHLKVQVCGACQRYIHLVDMGKHPDAIADVDEIAALPLDVWAHENGYRKIHPNLVGI